jgi:hypothetical protein
MTFGFLQSKIAYALGLLRTLFDCNYYSTSAVSDWSYDAELEHFFILQTWTNTKSYHTLLVLLFTAFAVSQVRFPMWLHNIQRKSGPDGI